MADRKRWHLVTYDVRDPKRLRRVYRLLRGYGEHLQYSVFRVRLGPVQFQRMRWELERLLEKEDDLLVIPLCPRCAGRVECRSERTNWEEEPLFQIIE